jgi:PrtD family type I secretion system ABC transporter
MVDRSNGPHSVLHPEALRQPVRNAILGSVCINVLALATPLYMLAIYDRVMTSRSEATLGAITIATVATLVLLAVFDLSRNIVFARASATFYAELEARVYAGCRSWALAGGSVRRVRPIEDLEMVRAFLGSPTPAALLDVVFVPLFMIVLFIIHFMLGVMTAALIAVIVILALINKRALARVTDMSTERFREACDYAEAHWRQVESSLAMGYASRGEQRAAEMNRHAIMAQIHAASSTGSITSVIKGIRQGSQIMIIATATYLALEGEVTMGAIIASSILFSRALMPIDQLVGYWKPLLQTRGAWRRLQELLQNVPDEHQKRMMLAPPRGRIDVAEVVANAPGATELILRGVTFSLPAGEALGIIGPSGSGKSTLAKVLLGIWPTFRGFVRMDGSDVMKMDHDRMGVHVGYLPQSVELLPGTIAENIRRLGADDPAGVVEAAQLAGAHDMILSLPEGYDTLVGKRGFALSGGQMQRIGLARAFYGRPNLVLLDEPDADLDDAGERALAQAVSLLRRRGTTVVLVSHRSALLQLVDKLLVMNGGQSVKFGTMDELRSPGAAPKVRVVT